jgi:periplasmic protein CpxP/Spy
MKRRVFAAITTSLLVVPFGVTAARANPVNNISESTSPMKQFGKNYAHANRMGRSGGMDRMLEQLNLSDEQSQQIEEIKTQSRTNNESLYQEIEAIHEEMRSLLAEDPSVEQLREQHQKMQALHQQLGDNRFETMLQIREVLTPEQRSQMAELIIEKRERRGDFQR